MPRINRNAAETDVPMIPPILLKESNLSLIAEAVAATIIEVMMTMLKATQHLHLQLDSEAVAETVQRKKGTAHVEWPREKNVPTVTGRWPDAINLRVMRSMAWAIFSFD